MHRTKGRRTIVIALLGLLSMMAALSHSEASPHVDLPALADTTALGISGMKCKCTYTATPDPHERFWLFQSEPLITGIHRNGPADGKLRAGDVIVGIDGMLIMTRRAGVRFANLEPGEPVELTVRRRNRTITETIIPVEVPSEEGVTVFGLDLLATESLRELSKAIESLARLSTGSSGDGESEETLDALAVLADAGLLRGDGESEETRDWLKALETGGLLREPPPPIGWLGFGLSFSGKIVRKPSDGLPARWRFNAPPKIHSIEPDGPADRADLKRGDVLTHIDGVRLDTRRGGNRFSSVEPGQAVTWTIRRDGVERTVEMVAEERP
jgi:predicted metalloprotease with PDZ domain